MTGKLAVVTGASTGMGREFAILLAKDGHDLVVAADESLDEVQRELTAAGATVEPVVVDLSTDAGVDRLAEAALAGGRHVDVLIVNAGVGPNGAFAEMSLDDVQTMIDLNVRGAVRLVHRVLPSMLAAHHGRILFQSSMAGTMPTPYQAVYGATKAFLYQFSHALRDEVKKDGITVTALLPGPTDTQFFHRAGMGDTLAGRGPKDDPAQLARQGYDGLMAGKAHVLGGNPLNQAMTAMNKVMPDVVKSKMYGLLAKPRSK